MNDELENKELSDLLKQLHAPEHLNAARRARIFAVLPSEKEDAQQVKREARRRIWHRLVKVAAIVVVMVVLSGLLFPARKGAVSKARQMRSMQAPVVVFGLPATATDNRDAYSGEALDSSVDALPTSLYVREESIGGNLSIVNGIATENRDAPNVKAETSSGGVINRESEPTDGSKVLSDHGFDIPAQTEPPPPMSSKPVAMNAVGIVKSPIVMRGIVGTPSAGQRAHSSGGAKVNQQAGEKSKHEPMDMPQMASQSEVAAEASKADASYKLEVAKLQERRMREVEKKLSISANNSIVAMQATKQDLPFESAELNLGVMDAEIADTKTGVKDASRQIQPQEKKVSEEAMLVEQIEEDKKSPPPPPLDIGPFTLIPTAQHPLSTFGLDTDTAGYTRSAMLIESGVRPEPGQIRQEEFINAFEYGDTAPTEAAFRIYIEGARSPFRSANNLLRVGVKGRRLGREEKRSLMLTILLDTSGSMETPERMPLARKAILALLAKLPEGDSVTILTCSDKTRKLFSGSAWDNPETFQTAEKRVNEIRCQGATNLEDGIVKAFESAAAEFKPHGENRVVIISDGIANLGSNNASEILKKVSENRGRGIRCSVIGVGRSSYNDTLLEAMANRGDGQYSFLDSERSIDESFVSDLENSFNTIASDVKIQVEWNRDVVEAYKSHGYDSRALRDEQFRDDTVDAGEVGSGQGVTVVYEMKLTDAPPASAILGTVRIRYRRTDTGVVEEIEKAITTADVMREFSSGRPQFRLACAVAEFATVLKHTPAAAQTSVLKDVSSIADVVAWKLDYYKPAKAFAETVRRLMGLGL